MGTEGARYEEGHLFVAAVRLLAHRLGRPPTMAEVAETLDQSAEIAYHIGRSLASKGIIRLVENPFETHVEIEDHLALEELPRESTGPGFGEDLEEFEEKKRKDREAMGDFFSTGGVDETKKKKLSKMEEEFRKFRRRREDE